MGLESHAVPGSKRPKQDVDVTKLSDYELKRFVAGNHGRIKYYTEQIHRADIELLTRALQAKAPEGAVAALFTPYQRHHDWPDGIWYERYEYPDEPCLGPQPDPEEVFEELQRHAYMALLRGQEMGLVPDPDGLIRVPLTGRGHIAQKKRRFSLS